MKKVLLVILIITLIVVGRVMLINRKAERNWENLSSIEKGMSADQVLNIMGEPMEMSKIDTYPGYSYLYASSLGTSGDFEIFFYEDSTVKSIYKGD